MKMKAVTLVLAAVFFAHVASATPIVYNFINDDNDTNSTRVLTVDGVPVTVSAYDDNGAAALINTRDTGWGVDKGSANVAARRIGLDERLTFDWAPLQVILMTGALFERGDAPTEMFDLVVDGNLVLDDVLLPDPGGNSTQFVDFVALGATQAQLSGFVFEIIGQTPVANTANEGIRVRQLTINVPAPPTVGLLIMGLIVLWRRSGLGLGA